MALGFARVVLPVFLAMLLALSAEGLPFFFFPGLDTLSNSANGTSLLQLLNPASVFAHHLQQLADLANLAANVSNNAFTG